MRGAWAWIALVGIGCQQRVVFEVDEDPCVQADAVVVCPACFTGPSTCTFEDVTVSSPADCEICQSRDQLYQELCDAGVPRVTGEVSCRY